MKKDAMNIYIAFGKDTCRILNSYDIRIPTHFLVENYKVKEKTRDS